MVSSFDYNDIDRINELGISLNPKFKELFHIDNLNKNEKLYVYKENNEILGFIHISINFEIVDLLNIVVDKSVRKKGIGSLLMDYMITDLPKETTRILLEVNESNLEALKFYYKFNFEVINERKNYYGKNSALIMERVLK